MICSKFIDFLRPALRLAGPGLLCVSAGLAHGQSLMHLYESARQQDPTYLAARADVDVARARSGQARAPLLPQVQLQAGVTHTYTHMDLPSLGPDIEVPDALRDRLRRLTASQNTSNARSLTLAGAQAIYHPADKIAWEQSREGINTADIALAAAQQDLMVRVANAYFDVLAAESNLQSVQALKVAIARQGELAQRNFDIGNATITDSREARARLDATTAQEIAAQNDLQVKRLALQELTGQPAAEPLPLAEPVQLPQLTPDTLQGWEALAEANGAPIRQREVALRVAELDLRKARAGHLPTVDLQVNAGTTHYNGNPGLAAALGGSRNASVGVQVTLPLFDGLLTRHRVSESLAAQDKAQAELRGSRQDTRQTVQAAFLGVQSGLARVQALESALESARSALAANELGYKVGVRINIDVLNAQSQVHDAENDLAQARYNVLTGLLQLKQAAGTLTEDDLAQVNALLQLPSNPPAVR